MKRTLARIWASLVGLGVIWAMGYMTAGIYERSGFWAAASPYLVMAGVVATIWAIHEL